MGDKYYRSHIKKLIAANPESIALERNIKVPTSLGGHKYEKEYIDITGVFYDRRSSREIVNDYGTTYTNIIVTKLLVLGGVDIKKGDTFELDDSKYRVVYPKKYGDICIQVELEVVR